MKFKLKDVISLCRHNITSNDFDIKNVKFCFIVKNLISEILLFNIITIAGI